MTAARARQLAERCFALARSTTFAGERDAAIGRGTAIAEKVGLSLDLFDIPGRVREARPRRSTAASSAPDPRLDELREIIRKHRQHMAEGWVQGIDEFVARAADAGSGFAAKYQQGRFDAAMRTRRARDARFARWPDLGSCADFCFSRGEPVYQLDDPEDEGLTWWCPGRDRRLSDDHLRQLADEIAGTAEAHAA